MMETACPVNANLIHKHAQIMGRRRGALDLTSDAPDAILRAAATVCQLCLIVNEDAVEPIEPPAEMEQNSNTPSNGGLSSGYPRTGNFENTRKTG